MQHRYPRHQSLDLSALPAPETDPAAVLRGMLADEERLAQSWAEVPEISAMHSRVADSIRAELAALDTPAIATFAASLHDAARMAQAAGIAPEPLDLGTHVVIDGGSVLEREGWPAAVDPDEDKDDMPMPY